MRPAISGRTLIVLAALAIPGAARPETAARSLHQLAERARPLLAPRAPSSELAGLTRGLSDALEQTTTVLAECERKLAAGLPYNEELALLDAERDSLASLDARIAGALDSIEVRLAAAGLAAETRALAEFRSRYRTRMVTLRSRLDGLAPGRGTASIRQARAELDGWLSRSGSTPLPAAHFSPAVDRNQPRTATAVAADVAETPLIRVTPEIQRLADLLERNPARLLAHVYNNVEFSIYQGYQQNSQAVLWSGRGNALDQASLLIALLRAAGHPARYVDGRIRVPRDRWLNWWGARTVEAAREFAAGIFGIAVADNTVDLDHIWVEVSIDDASGPRWIPLDPAFKTHEFQPGVRLPVIPFDWDGFFTSVKPQLATDWYFDQIRARLRADRPGTALSDLPYRGTIVPHGGAGLPSSLPYEVLGVRGRSETEFPQYHHRVILSFRDSTNRRELARLPLNAAERCLDTLAIAFEPTASSARAIELFGGLQDTPAFLANLVPQFRVNERVVASGSEPMEAGATVWVRAEIFRPFAANPDVSVDQPMTVGENAAIALEGVHLSDAFLSHLVAQLLEGETPLDRRNPDAAVRDILHIAGTRYNQHVREQRARIADALGYKSIEFRTGPVIFRAGLERQNLLDRPFLLTHRSMVIGALGTLGVGRNLDTGNGAGVEAFRQLSRVVTLTGIGLEHQIFEELFLKPGMSAVKGLQLAGERRVPTVSFQKANAEAEIAKLTAMPDAGKQLMRGWVNGCCELIRTPVRPIDFDGVQWITFFAERTSDNALIGELQAFRVLPAATVTLHGGGTGVTPPEPQQVGPGGISDVSQVGGTVIGDPVTVSNGNMFHIFEDLAIAGRGLPLEVTRTYNSQSTSTGAFGYGWSHNYEQSLRITGNNAVVVTANGSAVPLTRQGDAFVSPVVYGFRLTADGSGHLLRSRHGVTWRFDAAGKLVENADANGNKLQFAYDGAKLTGVTDALGRSITYSYSGNRVTSIQDFGGRTWSYSYDNRDNLISSTDPEGHRTAITYYSSSFNDHNLRSITDPEGYTIVFHYYANDKVFKTTDQAGGERRFFYLPFRRETHTIDERGFRSVYRYDEQGRTTAIVWPDGNTRTSVWNAAGLLVESIDETGGVTRFSHDAAGNIVRKVDPLGNVTELSYDPVLNRATAVVDPRGNTARFEYDQRGNLVRLVDPAGGATTFAYDEFGSLVSSVDPDGKSSSFAYENGQLAQTVSRSGSAARLERDTLGRAVKVTDALGQSKLREYDKLGRLLRSVTPLGETDEAVYDRIGRLRQRIDANGGVSALSFDGLGNLTEAREPTGESTFYSYASPECDCSSVAGLMSVSRSARGGARTFRYNYRGQPIELRNALGELTRYAYDARGNQVQAVYPDGTTVRSVFDAANRLVERTRSGGDRDVFTYDAAGNMLTASNASVTYKFTYDVRNLVASAHDSRFAEPVRYEYDAMGRMVRLTDPQGGVTAYEYDDAGRVSTLRNPAGLVTTFAYDALGRRRDASFANGTRAAYEYDASGRLTALTYTSGETVLNRFLYEYDRAGNRVAMTDSSGRHEYSYDASFRLTAAAHPDQPNEQYTYDPSGNRVSSHAASALAYDAEDRLAESGGAARAYDGRGNMTARGSSRFAYDATRSLVHAASDGGTIEYRYDPLGRRIEKNVNGKVTRYLYNDAQILLEYDGDNRPIARYTHGPEVDEPLVMERDRDSSGAFEPGETFFYQRDALGSVRALADSAGSLVEQYRYDSFGNLVQPEPSAASGAGNPFLFTGREWDAEIGLYYYRARHYEPAAGRFLQADAYWDPVAPRTLNRYAYVANNPVNFIDPTGNIPQTTAASITITGGGGGDFGDDRGRPRTQWPQRPKPPVVIPVPVPEGIPVWGNDGIELSPEALEELNKQRLKQSVEETGAVVGTGVVIYVTYRAIRLLPSLTPVTAWSLGPNLAAP